MPEKTNGAPINLDDIETFLRACEVLNSEPQQRLSFLQLTKKIGVKYTTAIGQLERVVNHFFGPRFKPPGRASGLDLLFASERKGGPLALTDEGKELRRRLTTLRDLYAESRTAIQRKMRREQVCPTVRLGIPHTVGLYLASYAYSGWEEYFGKRLKLKVELGNTTDLLGKVAVRLLDAVIGFGNADNTSGSKSLPVSFDSLGEFSRMVLASPGSGPLCQATRQAAARSCRGLQSKTVNRDAEKRESDALPSVYLDRFDPRGIPLIVVPSYGNVKELQRHVARWERRSTVLPVESYNDAIILARMGLGVAPVTESFALRSGLTFYRLEPEEVYRRRLGFYHHSEIPLSREAADIIDFLRVYLKVFHKRLFHPAPLPTAASPAYKRVWDKVAEGHPVVT